MSFSPDPIQTNGPSIPYDGLMSLDTDFNVWQRRAAEIAQPKIEGNSAISQDAYLIHLWTPAPPKMYIHPRRIKEHLFAEYKSNEAIEVADDEDDQTTIIDEQKSIFTNFSEQDLLLEPPAVVPAIRSYKSMERLPSSIDPSDEFQMSPNMIRSCRSCANLTLDSAVRFDTNYVFTLDETKNQIAARKNFKSEPVTPVLAPSDEINILSTQTIETASTKEKQGKLHIM